MRVVALVHHYVPVRCAGAETMLHSMLRALVARGHEVQVLLSDQDSPPYEVDGVRVATDAGIFDGIRHADILVSHLANTPRATHLGRWNGIPVVLVHHNTFRITKDALLAAQARVDLVAVNSHHMAEDLAEYLGNSAPATVVVRPLVDPADYATTPGDRVTLVNMRPMDVDSAGRRLGKGAELFWALAERMPDTSFLGVKGAYGTQMIGDLPNVDVLDHVPAHEMRDKVFARTRVLLMPSSYESWGRVGTEALHSGIPVIAHPTPGLVENLGDAGIFVERDDVDGWCYALRALESPAAYALASRRALARAAELHPKQDLDRWCDAVERAANLIGAR